MELLANKAKQETGGGSAEDKPGRIDAKPKQKDGGNETDENCRHINERRARELERHTRHQPRRCNIDAIENARKPFGLAHARDERVSDGDENKGGEKNADGGDDRAGHAPQDVTDKRCGGENGARRDLSNGDGIEQLLFGEPAEILDKFVMQKREQDIAAAIEDRTDFEKRDKEEGERK